MKRRALKRWGIICGTATAVLLGGGCGTDGGGAGWQFVMTESPESERHENVSARILPERWYAGDYGKKPSVRSQKSQSNCWAVAAASALESALLPETELVFSPDHFVYGNAFSVDPDLGGSYYMAMAYLSGWQGPVSEADVPASGVYPDDPDAAVHVQEIQILENADTGQLKEMVYRYGAVQASLYLNRASAAGDSSYYQPMTSAYYCAEQKVQDHDVIILGWDDNFSRFLFKEIPNRDGAFICQNSWGSDFGEDGIFYVSYEDVNLGVMAAAYSGIEPADNYSDIYQTDDCGWQSSQGYGSETCWFANVYTARREERLAAAGFYATSPGASYELYFVPDFESQDSFQERQLLQSGTFENAGYYTVSLDQDTALLQGQRFAVIVKLTTPGRTSPVAVEHAGDPETQNVTLEGKDGYLSQYGDVWQHTEQVYATNVCLKAYTKPAD